MAKLSAVRNRCRLRLRPTSVGLPSAGTFLVFRIAVAVAEVAKGKPEHEGEQHPRDGRGVADAARLEPFVEDKITQRGGGSRGTAQGHGPRHLEQIGRA